MQKMLTSAVNRHMVRTELKRILVIFFLIAATGLSGCSPRLSDPDISMIALRGQTGLLGQSFRIEFRRDGKASIECNFYNLNNENKPRSDFKLLCDDLYRQFPDSFRLKGNQLESRLSGISTSDKFTELSNTLNANGYFSMEDGWEFDGRTDAPPDFVEVEFNGGKKEVGDRGATKNEQFSAIKNSIYELGKATTWAKK